MRVRRHIGVLAAALALVSVLLVSCSDDDDQPTVHTIAIIRTVAGSGNEQFLIDGIAAAGVDEDHLRILGRDIAETHPEQADAEAAVRRWVERGAELIVALSTRSAMAAVKAAPDTPVLVLSTDPSATGLVDDERHPEGNVTGASYRVPADRTLSLANDAFADVDIRRVGCLQPVGDPAAVPARTALEHGAAALGMELICATFTTPEDVGAAVQEVLAAGVDAIVPVNAPATAIAFPQLRFVLSKTNVPVIANQPADFAVLTLTPDGNAVYRTMGRQAGRILTGTPVRDVPVEDPGRFLLVVDLTVAQRIGRTVAPSVLERADRIVGATDQTTND
jgi:putative tryptophan/tyrosine transport system substrate-binding protein